jgi:16S rRNA (guanine1207-N2)-methyltransferase
MRKTENSASLPEWASEPGIAPGTWVTFQGTIHGKPFSIFSFPGIFSHDHLDEGTQLLLNTVQIPPYSRILDVGCGYGIIGLYAASQAPTSWVDLIDSNRLAVAASRKNILANKLENAQAFTSDLLDGIQGHRYQLIISNPPFHAGKEVNYAITVALLEQASLALEPGGELIIVANQFIRYDKLMMDIFGNIRKLAQTNRFHILSATNNG